MFQVMYGAEYEIRNHAKRSFVNSELRFSFQQNMVSS